MDESGTLLLRVEDVARLLMVSKRTIWRMIAAGKVPAPINVGRGKRWFADEIRAWLNQGCPTRRVWDAIWRVRQQVRK